MKTTKLGRSGLEVSRLALGMMTYGTPEWRPWVLTEAQGRPVVQRAVELGVNFFDTADMYSGGESEVLTGRWVREFFRREDAVIATKVYYPVGLHLDPSRMPKGTPLPANSYGLSRKRVMHAVDDSLKRLGTDYIDLYIIHRFDPHTPVEETMGALHDVVKAGKVRYLGASSMWTWQFAKMQETARAHGFTPFVSMQNHYNLAYREEEREMIPFCRDQGIAVTPWSPLARGFLAGNRSASDGQPGGATQRARTDDYAARLYFRESDFRVVEALRALAARRGVSMATLAYAWLLHQPGVTSPIIGASKPEQLEAAAEALDLMLTQEEMAVLQAQYEAHPVLDHE